MLIVDLYTKHHAFAYIKNFSRILFRHIARADDN